MEEYELRVSRMQCIGCERLIEDEIDSVDDIARSNAHHEAGIVEFTAVDPETGSYVEHLIRDLGYEVTDVTVE